MKEVTLSLPEGKKAVSVTIELADDPIEAELSQDGNAFKITFGRTMNVMS